VSRSHMIRVVDADHALDVLDRAVKRRWRVTVGFWEVRTEEYEVEGVRKKRKVRVKDPATGRMTDTFVHTVRTLEIFDIDLSEAGDMYATGIDACPRDGGGPAIRRARLDRITDITVHKYTAYRMPNAHFIGRVRAHAAEHSGEGWGYIAQLTDDALWALIDRAYSSNDAIERATYHATMHN
jgi:hypothetical protein